MAVPPEKLPEFLVQVQNVLKNDRVTATLFCHASHGQVHIRPFLDLNVPEDVTKMQRLSDNLYEKVFEVGGVISGEHALGLSRSWFARRQLGNRYAICRRIKDLFDPNGILNPGKLITDAPQRVFDNLRPTSLSTSSISNSSLLGVDRAELELVMGPRELRRVLRQKQDRNSIFRSQVFADSQLDFGRGIGQVAQGCNGCGRCRTTASAERMCPMFRVGRDEESSPRAKANAIRAIISGKLPVDMAETDELKALADLCFQCHQCRLECPASVDIPKLVTELKAQYVATNGLRISDHLLTRLDLLAAVASRSPRLANWALENRQFRWILEKFTGIAQGRRLPRIAQQSFMRWASRRRLNRPRRIGKRKVLFFVDQYANWHNPLLGQALVHVFEHQKVEVYVPTNQNPSWMAKIAMGDIARVRKMIGPSIKRLADAVRQGYDIVSLEPSATLCLQHEYPNLIDSEDAHLVAKRSFDAGRYLWNMHQSNELELDFSPLSATILYHQPCHLKAIDAEQPGLQLMKLIPGLNFIQADAGCSGMAGTFGMRKENYRTSLRIGLGLINKMQQSSAQFGSTECSACKLQMEQGVDRPTIHPIAVLAHSYRLLPEVGTWMKHRNEGLVVQ